MQITIIVLEIFTAMAAFLAGFLWFKASRIKAGLDSIVIEDGLHDELVSLKSGLKKQSRLNAMAALYSCIAACFQVVILVITMLKQ